MTEGLAKIDAISDELNKQRAVLTDTAAELKQLSVTVAENQALSVRLALTSITVVLATCVICFLTYLK